jgi:biopolymer transport protein ExbD
MKIKFRHKPTPHVPFIALADIAWQIIIFFLVASSFAQNESLNVDLPSGSSQSQGPSESNITVQAGESVLMIDGHATEMSELQSTLTRQLESRNTEQGKAVVLELRDDLSFQRCADIMYAVQQAGGTVIFSEAGEP